MISRAACEDGLKPTPTHSVAKMGNTNLTSKTVARSERILRVTTSHAVVSCCVIVTMTIGVKFQGISYAEDSAYDNE